jgi:hypothetical protein
MLAQRRETRGLAAVEIVVFAPADDPAQTPPDAGDGLAWAPHLVSIEGRPALVWERATPTALATALDAPYDEIAVWAAQPQALLRLAAEAPRETAREGPYLSLRWVLAHGDQVATIASAGVEFAHVSIHASPEEMVRVRDLLRDALGLVVLPRPRAIQVPGHWLAAGDVRVHLNAREGVAPVAAGTAPNHICLGVADIDAAQVAVESHDFSCQRAGSLAGQVWFRLASGTVIELQPRRGLASIHRGGWSFRPAVNEE